MKKPIIIIPGIQGTKLSNINKNDFDTIWSGIHKYFDNLYDLTLELDGETDKTKEVIIERQDVEDIAYSEIINFLKHKGYPIYIFGYDWRKSNIISGKKLYEFVRIIQKKHNISKINFITHSMGCLVFSGFFKQLSPKTEMQNIIEKVIFTVPPFQGSVEAMFNIIIGKSKLFNSSDDFRKIARTFPSIFELCPVYNDAISFNDSTTEFDLYNFEHWQQKNNLDDDTKEQFETRLNELKKVRCDNNLIFDFSKLSVELRKNMLVIAGIGDETQKQLKVNSKSKIVKNQFIFSKEDEDDNGDGTVHLKSAEVFKDYIKTVTVKSRWIEKRLDGRIITANWHSFFLNNGRVQNIIKRFLEIETFSLDTDWHTSVEGNTKII
ncbi:lipase family alpha/beta hydrolase [Chondrinema litorale]|uniref:lipase family alpha/beta hydrolase n=1 Tax=Chondrinema litorale TaxID=2994555 RepID=UPI00254386E7|nr:alpha/beta hydrolase [Chondrinema litorale]UZS00202.1 alpha/beta hydrolase [Chondrinema litorale]